MRLCVFEDAGVLRLEPLTLTRPAFALLAGAGSILDRQRRAFRTTEIAALIRPHLVGLCRELWPEITLNESAFCRKAVVLVNARWLPPARFTLDADQSCVGLCSGQVAYVVLQSGVDVQLSPENIDAAIELLRRSAPEAQVGGTMVNFLWDMVEAIPQLVAEDRAWFAELPDKHTGADAAVIGAEADIVVDASATVEPHVVIDTRPGPVLIDREAIVQAFSRIEGPCYIGPQTWIVGAKVRGGAFGPMCKLGGEVEASIVQGHSNKYHDGFLGHSFVGEWVNLAAGTQISDLRNDYGSIKVNVGEHRIPTGKSKVGSFIGDHTKTGLAALLNTGSSIGVFCNLLPSGGLLPSTVPSFCRVQRGDISERSDLRSALTTAETVLRRRGKAWTDAHRDLFYLLYDQTAERRRRASRESEQRRARYAG